MVTSILAIIVPIITFILLVLTGYFVWRGLRGLFPKKGPA
jgi:hypothetical protein